MPDSPVWHILASPSVSAISLRAKAHYLATLGESRRYVVAFSRFADAGIWLHQESLRHILASPGYAPGTIAVNVSWMERGFNAGQTHRSMYPSIFNRLRAIARYCTEIATFSYPLAFNAHVGVIPLDDLRDFWWVSCRMARLQYGAKISPKS